MVNGWRKRGKGNGGREGREEHTQFKVKLEFQS